ncbi:Uncharacterised protein [Zhongshania aliphaticivorans]|uniref:Uncharacterized protein n=1 Tax=Zhongshania aliphaticivorans TaxID=1470434 RepID=A0A5S9Q3Q8_9GAMM|nr:hypothetical protein [Zhongshania aliphaticivorans]CAA0111595.1 Uncharacterised protein [Zhongshania aliphaticivorans]CAA0118713.1 Uncharacterised protein [Zhongshania aliphaticivorans]
MTPFLQRSINAFIISAAIGASSVQAQPGGQQGGERGRPPEEAFTACADLSENQACSVSIGDDNISGSCLKPPRGEDKLLCVPENGRPPKSDK